MQQILMKPSDNDLAHSVLQQYGPSEADVNTLVKMFSTILKALGYKPECRGFETQ
jgi:hypothetical protein